MAKAIRNLAVYFGFTVTCMAPTGIAASNLPNGRTIHNACGINPQKDINKFEAPLSNNRKLFHQKRLKKETIALVVIDEVSAIPPHQFGQIEWRLRDIMSNGSFENTESPSDGLYGGLAVLLMVHFFLLIIFIRLPSSCFVNLHSKLKKCSRFISSKKMYLQINYHLQITF